jgi:hypothetical protein
MEGCIVKTFYLMLDGDIITDAIEYEVEGYTEVTLNQTHLPAGINGGYYRWTGTAYEKDEALYQSQVTEIVQNAIDEYTLELLEAGIL